MARAQRHLPTEIKESFEALLSASDTDFVAGEEYPTQLDFRVNGKQAQAGIHLASLTWRVRICVGPVTTDPGRLDALLAAIGEANAALPKRLKHATLIEEDCYLWALAKRDFMWMANNASLQQKRLAQVLADATALAAHGACARLLDDFARPI